MPWCFGDESNPYSDALLARLEAGEEALVPCLWPFEVTNALVFAKQRGRAVNEVRALAEPYRLTAYDAAYLELSMRADVPLATLDEALRRAVLAAGAKLLD